MKEKRNGKESNLGN